MYLEAEIQAAQKKVSDWEKALEDEDILGRAQTSLQYVSGGLQEIETFIQQLETAVQDTLNSALLLFFHIDLIVHQEIVALLRDVR